MPFTQPTGVSLSGSRGTLATPHTTTNTAPSLASNTSTTSLPTRKKFEPEKLCQVRNQWVRSASDSIHIFTKSWQPLNIPVLSVVVFVHDIMEHCERYQPLFVQFAARGIEVQAFDLPGFGETGAREDAHGITGGYDVLLKEIDSAIDRAQEAHPTLPIFLMGHGMGGALALNYVCGLGQRTPLLAGIISSSPYLQPTIRGAGTRFPSTYNRLGKWYPNVAVGFRIQAEELTRDLSEMERVLGDGLIRDTVSLQCLGDMIYQGQKVLKKRWKKFPTPLPLLLLHGTDDPICSYQATHTLSSQILKRQPLNFIFKSWKGNMHDPHWDLDANAVRSEYTTWIRNNCRHFDKLPLEPSMVHWDSIRSSRSTVTSSRSIRCSTSHHSSSSDDPSNKGGKKDKKADKKREKQVKEDRKRQEKLDKAEKKKQQKLAGKNGAGSAVPGTGQDGAQVGGEAPGTVAPQKAVSNPANAEPEAIQDLEGLRRLQEMSKQKAIEKRREYNLETPLPPASEGAPADAGPVVDEQQQAGQKPPEAPAPPSGDQHQQGVILTVITGLYSPTTSTLPHQIPLPNTSQSSLSSQQDPESLQSTISDPVVKEQTEMEKSLEAVAQTLSRHNSLNHLHTATATAIGISGSVSMPALSEATVISGVEPAVDATSTSIVPVDAQDAPSTVAPPSLLEEGLPSSTTLQPSATITNAEDIAETTATRQAEEIIILQEQEQEQQKEQEQEKEKEQEHANAPDHVVHADPSLEAPSSSSSIEEEAPEQVASVESPTSPELASTSPGQFPSPNLTPTATIASTIEEVPAGSKVDDIIAS